MPPSVVQPATSYPPRVTSSEVIAKCDYFTRVHLWPLRSALDPEAWLRNFKQSELDHAVHLLNSFMYFHHNLVLKTASLRAGIPDTDGSSPDDWQGYEKRGLVLALYETIPDSTLCMLRWNKNGWNPLMVKA
jgi:hypothetical protein